MDVKGRLSEVLSESPSLPFLFVGSGISRRYLGLPDWAGLLEQLCDGLPHPYGYYYSYSGGDLAATAETIAADFFELWWRDDRFAASRSQWGATCRDRRSPLKIEVANLMRCGAGTWVNDSLLQEEVDLLKAAVVDGIITTNYDGLMEELFPAFSVFVGQDELLTQRPQEIAEIYKIHGSCVSPDSIVLTTSDYERFRAKQQYIAAKLLTVFIERPVIFLGYSMSDSNVQNTLCQVVRCLGSENVGKLHRHLVLVEWDASLPQPLHESTTHSVQQDEGAVPIPLLKLRVPNFLDVFSALTGLKRKFSPRLLRHLRSQLYELVLANDPAASIVVQDIDDSRLDSVEVVVGVGISSRLGLVGITNDDLMHDILYDDLHADPAGVVAASLPNVLNGPLKYVPVYKYLREAGFITGSSIQRSLLPQKIKDNLANRDADFYKPSGTYRLQQSSVRAQFRDLVEMLDTQDDGYVLVHASLLDGANIDLKTLGEFLRRTWSDYTGDRYNDFNKTMYRKLVCLYDDLENGPAVPATP